jgi:2-polyprenyl-3-methyl-5-hydroxy-6-metoxy-1,4-benzoquinol methylase
MLEQGGAVILIGEQVFIREINELQWTCPRLRSVLCIDSPHFYSSLEQANPLMKKELWEYVGETAEDDIAGGGWKSSYTGEKFSREVMDEYAANAFLKLKPYLNLSRSVLEIGCASGITMYKVAPEVKSYTGTDLSASIIEFNRLKCAETGVGNITLACMGADEIDQLEPQRFDIIVINSVIQAFNGLNYLRRIIGKAFRLLNDDGILFIGDVMDLDSRDRLLRSVRAYKLANPEANTKLDFSNELFVARGFFRDCIAEFHGISAVEVSPKLHTIANELTEFRYDVLLRKGQTVEVSKSKQQSGAITL